MYVLRIKLKQFIFLFFLKGKYKNILFNKCLVYPLYKLHYTIAEVKV